MDVNERAVAMLKTTRATPKMFATTKEALLQRCATIVELAGPEGFVPSKFYAIYAPNIKAMSEDFDDAWAKRVIDDAIDQVKIVKHPMQPLVWVDGVIRFKENKIVRTLLEGGPFDMNKLAVMGFSADDRTQFAQLIGYSVSGIGDLSYVDPELVSQADIEAADMYNERK